MGKLYSIILFCTYWYGLVLLSMEDQLLQWYKDSRIPDGSSMVNIRAILPEQSDYDEIHMYKVGGDKRYYGITLKPGSCVCCIQFGDIYCGMITEFILEEKRSFLACDDAQKKFENMRVLWILACQKNWENICSQLDADTK